MKSFLEFLRKEAKHLEHAGLFRRELPLSSAQGPVITVGDRKLINFTSNDYLGLCDHPDVKVAAIRALEYWGAGLAAPRMASGSTALHEELERSVADFLGTADAIVYPSGYHANTGLFEALVTNRDYVFCDEQVRPSLADGLRLCRARVYSYRNRDMAHLEDLLKRSRAARFRLIATDGVFPLSGLAANLQDIYALAAKYDALVAVDDSQGIGVLGDSGRGTHSHFGVTDKIDLMTGSFGVVLGGGAGGFAAGRREIISWLRQKSRPYITATALPPVAAAAAQKAIDVVRSQPELRDKLKANIQLFRDMLSDQGLWTAEGEHPAVAVLVRHALLAQRMTDVLFRKGVYAIGYAYPVVPDGAARIRAQVTALHTEELLSKAATAFAEAAKEVKLPEDRKR